MSAQSFQMDSGNTLLAQPSTEKLILVSSDTGDGGSDVVIHGTVGSYTSETVTLGTYEVQTTNTWTALSHVRIPIALLGNLSVYAQGVAAAGSVIFSSQPGDGDTLTLALDNGDSPIVYTFVNTLSGSGYEVKIGATASDTATNFKKAINDEGTEGTHYGTDTDAHPHVTAEVSGISVTITDRLAVRRRHDWILEQTGGALSLTSPIGGENGTLLATIEAGDQSAHGDIDLENEDLSDANLPAGLVFVSDWIRVNGKAVTLNLIGTSTPALPCSYQTSTDGSTARAGQTSLTSLGSGTFFSANPSENAVEYIRFLITNSDTVDRNVHAMVIYG